MAAIRCLLAGFPDSKRAPLCQRLSTRLDALSSFQETYDALMVVPVTWFIRADGTIYRKHQGPATREWFEEQVKGMLNATGDRP